MINWKSGDYDKRIRIKPEGWVDSLVIEFGEQQCGQAICGLGIRINDDAGGVLTLDDMTLIRDTINKHLSKISNKKENA